jgi:hypothetical protein
MHRHVCMHEEGDMTCCVGELQQPNMLHLDRSLFHAAHVLNKQAPEVCAMWLSSPCP